MIEKNQIWITKKINDTQRKFVEDLNLSIIEEPLIEIKYLDFPNDILQFDGWIFTSQNALKNLKNLDFKGKIYVFGQKSENILKKKGYKNYTLSKKNILDLGNKILNDKCKNLLYLCGNLRLDILSNILKKHNINLTESVVYETHLVPKKLNIKKHDSIFFFSPSAVKSFSLKNNFSNDYKYYCIGETTAEVLKKFGQSSIIPKNLSFESMITTHINKN
tara:strand:+ start:15308 stop:15964 length:657 start_codon:yes stop_codon:yes gene_type:complete